MAPWPSSAPEAPKRRDMAKNVPAEQKLLRPLWLALACSWPLFAVQFLRLDHERLHVHVAVPMVIMGAVVVGAIAARLRDGGEAGPRLDRRVAATATVFFLLHAIAVLRAIDPVLALRETIKLGLGIACLWGAVVAFPRRREDIERFWTCALSMSAALYAALIYRHYFVFRGPYLSGSFSELTPFGRNHTAQYLIYVVPLAVCRLLSAERRWTHVLTAFVLVTALVYGGSRGTILAVLSGFLWLAKRAWSERAVWRWPQAGRTTVLVALVMIMPWIAVSFLVPHAEAIEKFHYLINPRAVPRLHSYEERGRRITDGLALFRRAPIFGVGVTNAEPLIGTATHCDYITVAAEQGLLGLACFAAVLLSIGSRLFSGASEFAGWAAVGMRMGFIGVLISMVFINTYSTPIFWIFLGLCLVQADIEAASKREVA
jgi:hypothetical protein